MCWMEQAVGQMCVERSRSEGQVCALNGAGSGAGMCVEWSRQWGRCVLNGAGQRVRCVR